MVSLYIHRDPWTEQTAHGARGQLTYKRRGLRGPFTFITLKPNISLALTIHLITTIFTMSRRSVDDILTELEPLTSQLDPKDIITQSHPDYGVHVTTFSTKKDIRPPVVFAPSETEALSKIIHFLYKSKLDFHIRGHGFGSPSARDTMISLLRFTSFEYDTTRKLATVGTGATWVEVAKNMREVDPEYSGTS